MIPYEYEIAARGMATPGDPRETRQLFQNRPPIARTSPLELYNLTLKSEYTLDGFGVNR